MDPVLVLQHEEDGPLGWLGELLAEAALPAVVVRLDAGGEVPDHLRWSAVISLGGFMGAYEEEAHPYLASETRLLAEAADAGTPVLGICLGCQLLAGALGGRAYRGPALEIGFRRLDLTDAGRADPVLGTAGPPVLAWHHDTFDLPPRATLLARTDAYPHAFRAGTALGVQFHPEASPAILERWVRAPGAGRVRRLGHDLDALLAEARRREADTRAASRALLGAWLAEAAGRPMRTEEAGGHTVRPLRGRGADRP